MTSRVGRGLLAAMLLLPLGVAAAPLPDAAASEAGASAEQPRPADGFQDELVAGVPGVVDVAPTVDGRLLVATKQGRVLVVKDGVLLDQPALDLSDRLCTDHERGLRGVATSPYGYGETVFVSYTARGSDPSCPTTTGPATAAHPTLRVSRFVFRWGEDILEPASETLVVSGISSTTGTSIGGDLAVDTPETVLVAVGDNGCDIRGEIGCGAADDVAHDASTLQGKLLRLLQGGRGVEDNPWATNWSSNDWCSGGPGDNEYATCPEIYARGLHEPTAIAVDPADARRVRIDDSGLARREEIDAAVRAADYGWNRREGRCPAGADSPSCTSATPDGLTDPVYDYDHSSGCSAISGGAFVPRGDWPSALLGRYLFADTGCGRIQALAANGTVTTLLTGLTAGPVSLAFGPRRASTPSATGDALYYTTSLAGGQLRRLTPTDRAPSAVVAAVKGSGPSPLLATLDGGASSDPDGDPLTYLWTFGDGTPEVTTSTPTVTHTYAEGTWTASLRVRDPAGLTSAAVTLPVFSGNTAPSVTITSPPAGQLFKVGGRYRLGATVTDAEEGALAGTSLTWSIVRRGPGHDGEAIWGPLRGNDLWLDGRVPPSLREAPSASLEIRVTAKDAAGAATTLVRPWRPQLSTLTVAASMTAGGSAARWPVTLDGQTMTTPVTVTTWVGAGVDVDLLPEDVHGTPALLDSWSDGGSKAHRVVVSAAPARLTASLTLRGLLAQYFSTEWLTGPSVDRVDATPFQDWGEEPPALVVNADRFSVRWSGEVIPEFSETYFFVLDVDDGARLWVDGKLVVDDFSGSGRHLISGYVPLKAEVPAAFVLEMRDHLGGALCHVIWSSPSLFSESLPSDRLRPRLHVSMQPASAAVPNGYLADSGAPFGARGGLRFGWSADRSAWTRDRNVLEDQVRDTLVHVRDATWSLALPRGVYRVSAVGGDPAFYDSVEKVDAEGVRLLDGTPLSWRRFVTGSADVPVTDGQLTLTTAAGGSNVKLNAVTVELVSPQ
ncbi:MAG: PQQ-dependent sugar dehydrogenase [Kineosporiaceae bacterium]